MKTIHIQNNRKEFMILDFHAKLEWESDCAISFSLGRYSDTLKFPDSDSPLHLGERAVFECFGWLDVVYPCHHHIKVQIRANIGNEPFDQTMRMEVIRTVFEALSIPQDETYEVHFFTASGQTSIVQPVDRDGLTDRLD